MGKDNSCCKEACGKLYKAAGLRPAVKTIRRISHRTPSPPLENANIPPKPEFKKHNHLKHSEAAEAVPVPSKNQPEALAPTKMGGRQSSARGRTTANSNMEKAHVDKEDRKKTGIHIEDRFTDFINRSKMKLRTTSSLRYGRDTTEDHGGSGHPANISRKDSKVPGKDMFSEYINRVRAKIKGRSTSSIGPGKSNSFK
ncbi:hypothetical protein K2173_003039 [Erythroxylum novogranatense]|uniref:Uncharacterized protein n=1 Tax=Erythroxylum novogranatense TaxID=1862640 RepID=A0AAV8S875_9ROSI|nr:hypothetical protein K2173_003039 [Erythroxylum novogranatense]